MEVDEIPDTRPSDHQDKCLALETPSKQKRAPRTLQTVPDSSTKLEVYLRVRPKNASDVSTSRYEIIDDHSTIHLHAPNQTDTRQYSFNYVFGEAATNEQVFDKIGVGVIDRFLSGYTNLLFTYGITGSGKTHTISGDAQRMDGLLPNIMRGIFAHDTMAGPSSRYKLRVSYLENYTKNVLDLLGSTTTDDKENQAPLTEANSNVVAVRVLNSEHVELCNLSSHAVENAQQALRLIETGNRRRATAHTRFNTNSSRSHSLFIVDLCDTTAGDAVKSQLCIVDLAGAENVKKAGFSANDARFQESRGINSSLSVLGRCLECIQQQRSSSGAAGTQHVPWRESSLTKLLWQYLHGKGYVTMIVTAHITDGEYNETMRALEFAASSQNIVMNPVVNSVRPTTAKKKARTLQQQQQQQQRNRDNNKKKMMGDEEMAQQRLQQDLHFLSTCTMDQLRRIAVESYQSVMRCKQKMQRFARHRNQSVLRLLEKLEKEKAQVMHDTIAEEEQQEQHAEKEEEYQRRLGEMETTNGQLSQKLTQYACELEEKAAELKHVYHEHGEMATQLAASKKELMEAKCRAAFSVEEATARHCEAMEETQRAHLSKLADVEQAMQQKRVQCAELEQRMDAYEATQIALKSDNETLLKRVAEDARERESWTAQEQQIEGRERRRELELVEREKVLRAEIGEASEANKQLRIENNGLRISQQRYQASLDESEQKMERLAHLNRELKAKTQQQRIAMTEHEHARTKLAEMMDKLKTEHLERVSSWERAENTLRRELEQTRQIHDDAQKEIVALHNQFDALKKEFAQRGEELSNVKRQVAAKHKLYEQQQLLYAKDMRELTHKLSEQTHAAQTMQDEHREEMRQVMQEKEGAYAQHCEKQTTLKQQIEDKDEQIRALYEKLERSMADAEGLQARVDERADCHAHLERLQLEYTRVQQELSQARDTCGGQRAAMANFQACEQQRVCELRTMQTQLRRDVESFVAAYGADRSRWRVQVGAMASTKTATVDALQQKLAAVEREYRQCQNAMQNTVATHAQLIAAKDEETTQWRRKCDEYQTELDARLSCARDLEREHQRVRACLQEKADEIQKWNAQRQELERGVTRLEQQSTAQQVRHCAELEDADQEFLKADGECKELHAEKDALEQALQRVKTEATTKLAVFQQRIVTLEAQERRLRDEHSIELQKFAALKNLQLEQQNQQSATLQRQIASLESELQTLKIHVHSEEPFNSKRVSTITTVSDQSSTNQSSTSQSGMSTRKRARYHIERESETMLYDHEAPMASKKRKVTIDGAHLSVPHCDDDMMSAIEMMVDGHDDDDDDDRDEPEQEVQMEHASVSEQNGDVSLLQPQHLTMEEEEDAEDDEDAEMTQSPARKTQHSSKEEQVAESTSSTSSAAAVVVLASPALSHLSEGDEPLPKAPNTRLRKALRSQTQKREHSAPGTAGGGKYRVMRTPATKESKRRFTSCDASAATAALPQPTPTSKDALMGMTVVNLRAKLKKRNLKCRGNKKELVSTLVSHFETGKEASTSSDESSEPLLQSEMVGRCVEERDGNKYYSAMRIEGVLYRVGDEVYINSGDGDDKCWLGAIVSLYEKDDGERYMGNSWYWCYSEIKKAVKSKPYSGWRAGAREVFLSEGHAPDNNHITLVNYKRRFKVFATQKAMDAWIAQHPSAADNVCTYFCQYAYNLKMKALVTRTMENGKIERIDEGDEQDSENEEKNNETGKEKVKRRKTTATTTTSADVKHEDEDENEDKSNARNRRNRRRKRTKKTM